mmetsp:Transcript_69368/g.206604  ORF Transcript_69368/g.206604 Transcript_69368/m.206604 type:complete len:407 (+) Transcript_69368:70-1290(+)|eukprot:CAMPEP_0175240226 /NCGR_PEP_ID=MMETSP0093-20121207/29948_1 /TAXON_ID=311494 /ORGANISM="Alexandrium monilatum, Strain CCMP3105" /LENGTH=406 /DNA_ID=CAMNT_0016534273 /DNA_START=63 /DNA_END=1283 /DNA_ORIENTATION=+
MGDAVEAVYDDFHAFFRVFFVHLFVRPIMLLLALATMVQWHVRKSFNWAEFVQPLRNALGRPSTYGRRVALNVLILQIYFDPDMPDFVQHRKFFLSVLAIIFETIILRHGLKLLAIQIKGKEMDAPPLRSRLLELQAIEEPEVDLDPRWDDDPDAEPGGDLTESMYMDLTVGFHSILPIFIIQLSLMAFYIDELNDPSSDTKDSSKVEFGYWLVGVLIQLFAANQLLGSPYNGQFWKQVLTADPENPVCKVSEKSVRVFGVVQCRYWRVWLIRSWMDFLVNSIARDMLMYTFPIMLCVEEPLDFVKDCCAVFFITTLDDTGFEKAKTIPQMMVRLKFNIFYDHIKTTKGEDQEIPLKFTKDEAESAKFDPMVWDQFEKQRGYVSPFLPQAKLLDHMMDNVEPQYAV